MFNQFTLFKKNINSRDFKVMAIGLEADFENTQAVFFFYKKGFKKTFDESHETHDEI